MSCENEIVECPICMDPIPLDKNRVTTECGHCFHSSCLMKNVAHNGFNCPYCRDVMAETPDDDDSEDDYDEFSIEEYEENDYSDNVLRGARWLFQRAEGEELDDEEDSVYEEDEERADDENNPPVDFLVDKLKEQGVTMTDLVKAILIRDHNEYSNNEDFERVDNEIFGKFRILISNYQPPAPLVNVE